MAISGSFKQPCPSCGANVPVKDASLIGKKVDCPTCKYRFVIADPAGKKGPAGGGKGKKKEADVEEDVVEVEEVAVDKPRGDGKAKPGKRRRDEEDDAEPQVPKRKGKKASASNTKLLIGIGLGGFGLILLAVAALFVSGVFSETPTSPPAKNPKQVAGQQQKQLPGETDEDPGKDVKGPAKGPAKDKKTDLKKGKDDKAPPASGQPAGPENTNFLPPSSEVVCHSYFRDFLGSPLGRSAIFEPIGPLKDAELRKKLGFSVLAIDDILTAESYSENWIFHVVHTTQPIADMGPLSRALELKPWPDKTTKYTCFEVGPRSAAWVQALAKLPLFVPAHTLAAQPRSASPQLLLHLRDHQTLIFAHKEPMLQYLQADGTFKATPGATRNGPYLSIKPPLREMLTRVESKPGGEKVLFSSVTELRAAKFSGRDPEDARLAFHIRPFWDVVNLLDETTDRIEYVAMSLLMKDLTSFTFRNFLTCNTNAEAPQLQSDLHDNVGPQVIQFFDKVVGQKVDLFTEPKPGDPKVKQPPKSDPKANQLITNLLKVTASDRNVDFTLDLLLGSGAAGKMRSAMQLTALGLLADADIASGVDSRFVLAEAGKTLGQKGLARPNVPAGTFPPGVFLRKSALRTAREPAQRISWMAGLLPYLGEDTLYNQIQFDKSWSDGDNWLAARTLVPQFLDPSFPLYSRYVGYPGMPLECAATHYVGIAGVGIDAAEAKAGDKAMAGKLGIFGYDRMTPLKTIAENGRGLANTVLLIRVPYDGPAGLTPWMAGGGSTVRSVPDKDSLAPFLSTDSKGEQGTFVLMADGSVRFLKKGISDEVFKAICTVDSPTPAGWKFDEDYPALKPPKEPAPPPLVAGAVPPGSGSSAPVKKGPPPGPKGAPAGWQEYTNEEGGFTVSMPAGAAPSSDPNPAGGAIVGFRFANPATQSLFQAGFQNLPASEKLSPEQLAQGIPEQIFDELKKGVLSSMPGFEASSEKPISLGKYQGREYLLVGDAPPPKAPIGKGPVGKGAAPKGKATKGAPGKAAAGRLSVYARFLIGQDRFYILVATTPGLTPDSPEYSAFFDSFKLTAK